MTPALPFLLLTALRWCIRSNRIEAARRGLTTSKGKTMSKTKSETKPAAKAGPAYRIYGVTPNEGKKATFFEVGAAWKNKDGKGFSRGTGRGPQG